MKEIDLKALFEIAGNGVLSLEESLHGFFKLLEDNYELRLFFENPLVPKGKKKKLVREICPGAERLFLSLLRLIIDNGLERSVRELAQALTSLVSERLQLTFADVETAYPLTESEAERVKVLVGGRVHLRVAVNRKLIGGLKFMTSDGRFFDGTIKSAAEKLKEELIYA